ncbi:GAF domain-containing protein [Tamaricihabitans halophyticus]|uniref:GAF domain-containing protein n=1 Tax=Tamaricihabitans halophyticus TaxID=1262583 RepID=A0A4R2R3F8_9PSEU|nr:helix-turn-helix domain-containing protein [Tamaricihabitans halophyticus]TCP54041.1 GAF domain-containing protein [Tamaricihabitans halophyticus]
MRQHLEAAVPVGEDPRQHARALARMHEAAVRGTRPLPGRPRPVIGASWSRMRSLGVDPEHGAGNSLLEPARLEQRRQASGLADALPTLRDGLLGVAEDAAQIMVVVDAEGTVLWRDGSIPVRQRADSLGFVEGMSWQERTVGTNAIGTALVARKPLQVYSAEHYVRSHHAWTCAAAPLHDPRDGKLLGVVDLSGPAATVHASTLALVVTVARLAEAQLRNAHFAKLSRLRSVAVPLLSRVAGPAVVIDPHGWTAATSEMPQLDRLLLPDRFAAGQQWLPAYGACTVEPLPGGWLLRPATGALEAGVAEHASTTAELDVRQSHSWSLTVTSASGTWTHALSPRHAEILYVLARHRQGRSAAQLSADLFGTPERAVTVRAELSRLRRHLGGLIVGRPYRFADEVEIRVRQPADGSRLLPFSLAPAVRAR